MAEKHLSEKIMDLLKEEAAKKNDEYINPNFLLAIREAISDYYDPNDELDRDNKVHYWICDMFGH